MIERTRGPTGHAREDQRAPARPDDSPRTRPHCGGAVRTSEFQLGDFLLARYVACTRPHPSTRFPTAAGSPKGDAMSAVTHPAAAFPGRAVARLRSVREDLDYARGKRLRFYLLGTVALIATLGPLVLAATNGLRL